MEIDDGEAIHYAAVARGTAVYASDGAELGTVEEILDNVREHIFDGIVFRDRSGARHFVDAPEVARTAERGVTLALTADEAARLPEHDKTQSTSYRPNVGAGRLSRMLGRGWRKQ
jgi:hypothetical protein